MNRKLETLEGHWFCPKTHDEDTTDYSDGDKYNDYGAPARLPETEKRMREEKQNLETAYEYSLVFGMSEEVMGQEQETYKQQIDVFLKNCDVCVRKYHMARRGFLHSLSGYIPLEYRHCYSTTILTNAGNSIWTKKQCS